MPLTKSFKSTVLERANRDPDFTAAMLKEGVQALIDGEPNVGKSLLRDCINATIGFNQLSEVTGIPSKSLQRMFSKNGNPQASNLFEVISALQAHNQVTLDVSTTAGVRAA